MTSNKLIPFNFDWEYYISIHPDLVNAGIINEDLAVKHYLNHGRHEQREFCSNNIKLPLSYYLSGGDGGSKIVIFLQWYLDESTEFDRFKCLQKNIDNSEIDHIHIFYEKNSKENLESKSANWKKVTKSEIEERLTYKYWLDYACIHYPEHIKVLINSDIYLLDSIKTLKFCKFDNRTMYCLTRKDLDKDGTIIDSRESYSPESIKINPIYSQDCWIFKDKLNNLEKINNDLVLGYENCDRIFKNNLVYHNIDFINLYPDIFCVHVDYREIKYRPRYNLNSKEENTILLTKEVKWQLPATTEKDAYIQHLYDDSADISNIYIGFSWAVLIDLAMAQGKNIEDLFDNLNIEPIKKSTSYKKAHTVCQHIHWGKVIPICKKIGITDLHISHCPRDISHVDNIKIHPWKLTASNFKHSEMKYKLYNKKYLFSFIGSTNKYYRSDIREKLKEYCLNLDQNKYSFIYELRDKWFYQDYVYNYQIKNMPWTYKDHKLLKFNQNIYNDILCSSVFSLCPEGTGPNTIRVWESMAVGVIPVIYSDDWRPPTIKQYSWQDFSIFIPKNDYAKTLEILLSIDKKKIKKMQLNALNAYKIFDKLTCF
jgi:hypothetical protein